jgi:hypothetical protein
MTGAGLVHNINIHHGGVQNQDGIIKRQQKFTGCQQ